jgi:3-methyladenine DNA glycosylase AlkD
VIIAQRYTNRWWIRHALEAGYHMAVATSTEDVPEVLSWLKRQSSKRYRDGTARYAIVAPKAFGVPVSAIRAYGKRLGKDPELAEALWQSGWYEARMPESRSARRCSWGRTSRPQNPCEAPT